MKNLFFAIDWRKRLQIMLLLVGAGAFLAIVAPFGTESISLLERLAYWVGLAVGGSIIGEVIVCQVFATFENLPDIANVAIVSILVAIPMTPIVALLGDWEIGMSLPGSAWLMLFFYVWVISIFMSLISYAFSRLMGMPHPATGDVDPRFGADAGAKTDPTAAFLERLPHRFRTAVLYAVSSEDHYLRVHTDLGEELILMRLADAIRELSETNGHQVHRSWWVAGAGIDEVRRDNGRTKLLLKSGVEVPVSRTYAKTLREAGII